MMFCFVKSTTFCLKVFNQPLIICRYVRNIRGGGPKLLKGTVKTVTDCDTGEYARVQNFQDFFKIVKSSVDATDMNIEEALTSTDDFGTALAKSNLHDSDVRNEKEYKSFIKKKIIARKYFNLEKETNLLTHAAKEQIRYLHQLNPTEWTPEILSQRFPITVTGINKLLKSNFVHQSPEKIKHHDAEVAKRWELLKLGEPSTLISFYTQRMWNEGKIMQEHYKGNPNLPNASPTVTKKVIIQEEKRTIGEYSAIIQRYVDYKKKQESSTKMLSTSKELQVTDDSTCPLRNDKNNKKSQFVFRKNEYHVDEERDTDYNEFSAKSFNKTRTLNGEELLHSQFKENLREEITSQKFKSDPEYIKWVEQQSASKEFTKTSTKPFNPKELFSKIPKYNKETIELKKEISRDGERAYIYDDKLGYQHPKGTTVKSKIQVRNKSHNKGTLYKVGQCVYDEDGEFLYKVPQ